MKLDGLPRQSRTPSLALAASALLGGCATILTGTTDTVAFDANVPRVRVTIDGQYRGVTPLALEMSRGFMGGQQFMARFEKPGYVTQEFKLSRVLNGWAILDISSPVTSGGIDVLTGSLLKYSPREYHLQMLASGGSAQSIDFRRGVELYGYALASFRRIQKDVARGGGESLATFAWVLARGDDAAARLIAAALLQEAPALIGATDAHRFVDRVNAVLAGSPALRGHRI